MPPSSEQITGFLQGITRGKRLLVLIGQKKALGIAVRNDRPRKPGQRSLEGNSSSLKFFSQRKQRNHTCKITCKNPVLGVFTRTEAVPDGL